MPLITLLQFYGLYIFLHYYTHHQELATMMLITTLVVSFLVCSVLEVKGLQAKTCSPDTTPA